LHDAGLVTVEMPRHAEKSLLLRWRGGAQMWKEEENGTARVNETRFAETKSTRRGDSGRRLPVLPDDDG